MKWYKYHSGHFKPTLYQTQTSLKIMKLNNMPTNTGLKTSRY